MSACGRYAPYSREPMDLRALESLYPVHSAVYNQDERKLRTFIEMQRDPLLFNRGLNPLAENFSVRLRIALWKSRSLTPLEIAILGNSPRIFNILLGCGLVDIEALSQRFANQTPLQVSITIKESPAFASSIIFASQERNAANLGHHIEYLNFTDTAGNRASHYAARKGFDLVLSSLALQGADLNARNARGFTPVQEAVINKKYATAIHLLSLPEVRLETDTMTDDLSFSLIQEAFIKDNVDLLKAILANNPEIKLAVEVDHETQETTYVPLIEMAALNESIACLAFLETRGDVLPDSLRDYVENNPIDFPALYPYLFPELPAVQI